MTQKIDFISASINSEKMYFYNKRKQVMIYESYHNTNVKYFCLKYQLIL